MGSIGTGTEARTSVRPDDSTHAPRRDPLPRGPLTPGAGDVDVDALRARARVDACLQCHKCSAGCPVAERADVQPAQVVRLVQLGQVQELLASRAIWLCASCRTCSTRCPAGVDLPALQDGLRRLCLQRGQAPGEPRAAAFHEAMLATVERDGRLNELGLVRRFKQRTGRLFEDLALGLALLRRGKIRLRRSRVRHRRELTRLVRSAREDLGGTR